MGYLLEGINTNGIDVGNRQASIQTTQTDAPETPVTMFDSSSGPEIDLSQCTQIPEDHAGIYYGTEGDDCILGRDNVNDLIDGLGGNDVIFGGSGHDTIWGRQGNDELAGEDGDDKLFGGNGTDILYGGNGPDFLHGEDGNDELNGQGGHDHIFGQNGNDNANGGHGNDEILGGDGNDKLVGDDGNDKLFGGGGNDILYGSNGSDFLHGEDGQDELLGENGDDNLSGNIGNDKLYGGAGNDILSGGEGADFMEGNEGDDNLNGNGGDDELYGGPGSDFLFGENGKDFLYGEEGTDSLEPGSQDDLVNGGNGLNDTVTIRLEAPATDDNSGFHEDEIQDGVEHLHLLGFNTQPIIPIHYDLDHDVKQGSFGIFQLAPATPGERPHTPIIRNFWPDTHVNPACSTGQGDQPTTLTFWNADKTELLEVYDFDRVKRELTKPCEPLLPSSYVPVYTYQEPGTYQPPSDPYPAPNKQ